MTVRVGLQHNYVHCLAVYKIVNLKQMGALLVNIHKPGRRGGLMVSALDSRSGGPGSSPGRGTALCSWARYFTLIVPLSTQVYKWVPANLLASHPGGSSNTPSRFMPRKPG